MRLDHLLSKELQSGEVVSKEMVLFELLVEDTGLHWQAHCSVLRVRAAPKGAASLFLSYPSSNLEPMEIPPYVLGLWCADGYWWSSSVGLSNVDGPLILRFGTYLTATLGRDRLRLRVYLQPREHIPQTLSALTDRISICRPYKMERTAYHVYVNSRPLLRAFRRARSELITLTTSDIGPYMAGRFDGDGSWGSTPRIVYSRSDEAETDQCLLDRAGISHTSVLYYSKANEYSLYIHKRDWTGFSELIGPFAWKATVGACRE